MKKAGAVFLAIFSVVFFSQVLFAQNLDDFPAKRDPATNLIAEREKSEIYSKLKCCACNDSFDKCVCPEAKEMKAYIDALIESKVSKDDIFYKVAKKYTLNSILDERIKSDIEKRLIKEAGEKRPQITLEPLSFDFGNVNKTRGKVSKIFKVQNKGNLDLIITNIRVSCSCTTASLKVGKNKSPDFAISGAPKDWKEIIKPGESGDLEVALDFAHSSMTVGKQTREIFIATNDPVYPQVTIKVEAQVNESNTAQGPALSGEMQNGVRLIKVIASKYKFTPDPIVIKSGEKARLSITSVDITHGLAISEFNVNAVIRPKETAVVEFVADKEGKFKIFCSVYCGPGHSHMQGTLTVLK
ncbi:MAG: DUF1573 domain-containing protein [Candidatus Omnitrophota bacterium]